MNKMSAIYKIKKLTPAHELGFFATLWLTSVLLAALIATGLDRDNLAEAFMKDSANTELQDLTTPVNPNRNPIIIDWKTYRKTFNKHYSNLIQLLVRQKLFMARVYEVFITNIKHKMKKLSYFTSINRYSDITVAEADQMLLGDADEEDEGVEFDDDDTVNRYLNRAKNDLSTDFDVDRTKREADDYSPNYEVNIQWVVPSNNPNYQPIQNRDSSDSLDFMPDIPLDQMDEVSVGISEVHSKLSMIIDMFRPSFAIGKVSSLAKYAYNWFAPEVEEEPNIIVLKDWRESGCIGVPSDQGYCASCYAFSTMSHLEWALCMKRDRAYTPLSVQYMVNCGIQFSEENNGATNLNGCQRGLIKDAPEFIKEYGVELEVNMPYVEKEGACPVEKFTETEKKGYFRIKYRRILRLRKDTNSLDNALDGGPVLISMRLPKNFLAYGGGYVDDCEESNGGHAMLIVGRMIEDDVEYLLIKNSYGIYWGLNGFFKFKKSAIQQCVKHFLLPSVTFPNIISTLNVN